MRRGLQYSRSSSERQTDGRIATKNRRALWGGKGIGGVRKRKEKKRRTVKGRSKSGESTARERTT